MTLLLPVLNEMEGLRTLLPRLPRHLFEDVVMLDGGSTDGSIAYARSQDVRIIPQGTRTYGEAMLEVMGACATGGIVQFSPDGNCAVEALPALVDALRQGADMVVVSRYAPPARSLDDGPVTALGNAVFTWWMRRHGHGPMTDALGNYRGYATRLFARPELWHARPLLRGPVLEPWLSFVARQYGWWVGEVPWNEPKRVGGVRKMRILRNGWAILVLLVRAEWWTWQTRWR